MSEGITQKLWYPQSSTSQLVVAIITVACIYLYFKFYVAPVRRLKRLGLPFPTPRAFSGNLFDYGATKQHIAQIEWQKKYGTRYATQFFVVPAIWIAEPELLKTIMVKDFSNFTNRFSINASLPPFDNALLDLKNQNWKRVRSLVIPTFTASKLKLIVPLIKEVSDVLINKLIKNDEKGEKIDIWQASGMFSMKVVLGTAFGLQFENEEQEIKLTKAASVFFRQEFGFKQTLIQVILFTSAQLFLFFEPILGGKWVQSINYITGMAKNVIQERRSNMAKGIPCRQDILQHMIEAGGTDKLTDDEIVSQSFLFLIAGYETTQNTLTFVCYSLAINPTVQQKLIAEIDTLCPDENSVSFDIISELTYLDMVVCETLRMYPPAALAHREVRQATTIDGIHLPTDVMLAFPFYALHHNSKYWPDPERFDPERFTPEAKAARHPFAYLPFGSGPRNCIGMRLALLEVKLAVIKLLQKVEFIATNDTEIPLRLKSMQTLSPENSVFIGIRKRY